MLLILCKIVVSIIPKLKWILKKLSKTFDTSKAIKKL